MITNAIEPKVVFICSLGSRHTFITTGCPNKMPNGINGRLFLRQLWPWRICLYWYLTHVKVDLKWWPWQVTPKHVWLNEMHMHAKYDAYVATMTYFKLTLKDGLDLVILPLYMCVSFTYTCMQNIRFLSVIVWKLLIFTHIFDLWPLMMTLTFYFCSSIGYTCIPNMKSLSSLVHK